MKTLRNVYAYFQAHEQHINYGLFKSMNLPLGSGMVESAKHLEDLRRDLKVLGCGGVKADLTICYICVWLGSMDALIIFFLIPLFPPPTARYARLTRIHNLMFVVSCQRLVSFKSDEGKTG